METYRIACTVPYLRISYLFAKKIIPRIRDFVQIIHVSRIHRLCIMKKRATKRNHVPSYNI